MCEPTILNQIRMKGSREEPIEEVIEDMKPELKHAEEVVYLDMPGFKAIDEAEVDLVLGTRIEKTLIRGIGIAHHAIGSSYYFNTFRYLPMPYDGYRWI